MENAYQSPHYSVAEMADADERAAFITKTYLHLAGAIGALVLIESILLQTPLAQASLRLFSGYNWLIVLGAFMFVSWIANSWAMSATSISKQYMGLALYVVGESVILLPLLAYASFMGGNGGNPMFTGVIGAAGLATLGLFAIMTAVVFITRKDFSFLRSVLMFGGFAALGLIVCAIFFGWQLGGIFTYAMIAFACCYILYDTSNVLHHYRIGQHVAASLALFASVALLFWYVLQLFMSRD